MIKNKLVNSFWDFIKRPVLATVVLIPSVVGISEYNRKNAVENEIFNFRYRGMEAKVVKVDYPITGEMDYILLNDGSKINQGTLINDDEILISIFNGSYYVNGVKQR